MVALVNADALSGMHVSTPSSRMPAWELEDQRGDVEMRVVEIWWLLGLGIVVFANESRIQN